MVQSTEFSEYPFVRPRGYSVGRSAPVTYVVLHTTEGAANSSAAENGAAYDARRTDDVSTHFFVDNNSIVQCVLTKDTAWTARAANARGIQIEMCGRASTVKWVDGGYYQALLENSAKLTARLLKKYGLPARFLTDTQLRNNEKGITTHRQVTRVLGGSHTDPGPNFPYDYFLGRVKAYMGITPAPVAPTTPNSAGGSTATAAVSAATVSIAALSNPEENENMHLVQLKGQAAVYLSNLIVRRHVKSPEELVELVKLLGIEKKTVTSLAPYGIEIK